MVKITSKSGYRSFTYSAAKLFNNLDHVTKCSLTIKEFVNNYWSKQLVIIYTIFCIGHLFIYLFIFDVYNVLVYIFVCVCVYTLDAQLHCK